MLGKGFFSVEPFNPNPYWDNTVINLVGAQKFDDDTVFPHGRYSVDVQAGSGGDASEYFRNESRRVIQTFSVNVPFRIRAYCGSKGNGTQAGINPYSGAFKANGVSSLVSIPSVSHIFGNAGSCAVFPNAYYNSPSGANCLGNGIVGYANSQSTGAGSCLHFIPVGGTFGTDYLYAVHVASSGCLNGGGGSAYGGAASGGAESSAGMEAASAAGGSTPYGNGGAGVYARAGVYSTYGNNGTGIGAGMAARAYPNKPYGGAAYFDGTNWVDSTDAFGGITDDGHIIVKYLGPLN